MKARSNDKLSKNNAQIGVGIMRKNKQKRKITDKKHAYIKAKKDNKNPIFNRNTGDVHLTSNREQGISAREAIVEWRNSTEGPNIIIKPIFDNTEEE